MRIVRTAAALLLTLVSNATAQRTPETPLVVSTEWLAEHLNDPNVVVLQISERHDAKRGEHIPGSRLVGYMSLVQDNANAHHELPSPDSLRSLFESVGISDASHVVLTGPPLVVTRAFYTLDYLGFPKVSALDGGLTKWKKGRQTDGDERATAATHSARPHHPSRAAT